jgi:hypothetical protein
MRMLPGLRAGIQPAVWSTGGRNDARPQAVNHRPANPPPHQPTKVDRDTIAAMVATGIAQADTVRGRRISEPTLRKHHRAELDSGMTAINTMVILAHAELRPCRCQAQRRIERFAPQQLSGSVGDGAAPQVQNAETPPSPCDGSGVGTCAARAMQADIVAATSMAAATRVAAHRQASSIRTIAVLLGATVAGSRQRSHSPPKTSTGELGTSNQPSWRTVSPVFEMARSIALLMLVSATPPSSKTTRSPKA